MADLGFRITGVTGTTDITNLFSRIRTDLPEAVSKEAWNVSQMVGGELRKSARDAGIKPFTPGGLYDSFRPIKRQKFVYDINLPVYAHYLDTSPAHKVIVKGKPMLEAWMEERYGWTEETMPFRINVRESQKYRFMALAMDRVKQRLTGELENGQIIKTLRKTRR